MKKLRSGKVRDVYEISQDMLVIVTTDRISAFDVILPKPVAGKGKQLNALSLFWFDYTKDIIPNHIISSELCDMPRYFQTSEFEGRAVLVKRLNILPFEFVVRGYMFGNMWQAYLSGQDFCGNKISGDYKLAEKLDAPLFTPSTKAQSGHDEYTSAEDVSDMIGPEATEVIRELSLELYKDCSCFAASKGLIIADTKFEFGLDKQGNLFLADEIFTPDSSRFWSMADYKTGLAPKSYDKQFFRDWLENNRIDGKMQFDNVPDEVYIQTAQLYAQCRSIITKGE